MVTMPVLSVRDFPDELLRQAKSKAVLEGRTLRELVIEAVKKVVEEKPSLKTRRTNR
jgi:hypothetical protein